MTNVQVGDPRRRECGRLGRCAAGHGAHGGGITSGRAALARDDTLPLRFQVLSLRDLPQAGTCKLKNILMRNLG